MASSTPEPGHLVAGRYRLERPLAPAGAPSDGHQGRLWLAGDRLAADAPMALRQIAPEQDQARSRDLWARLQGVLHPQVPRFGAAIEEEGTLWLVRDWQAGRTYRELLEARRERQMVFGAGEVVLLLRQLLPVLAALHSQDLVHGDLNPANLLRRDADGLPVVLDFALVHIRESGEGPVGATAGYAPPEQGRGEPPQPWMDLHALAVVALVLLSGEEPAALLDPVSLEWRWPAALESEPALRAQLERLLSRDPGHRFATAAQALAAFQALEMPESTGPVPRADRTVVLVPPSAPPPADADPGAAAAASAAAAANGAGAPASAAETPAPGTGEGATAGGDAVPAAPTAPSEPAWELPRRSLQRQRALEREEAVEGASGRC